MVITADKDGLGSVFEKELVDADVVISQPFWPAYSGRIGLAVLKRMKPFDVALHYTDRHRLPTEVEEELGLTFHSDVESLVKVSDVVSIHCP